MEERHLMMFYSGFLFLIGIVLILANWQNTASRRVLDANEQSYPAFWSPSWTSNGGGHRSEYKGGRGFDLKICLYIEGKSTSVLFGLEKSLVIQA